MILDEISVQDFGVYAGCQQAELTPQPGRPVILFGGMNGGGKTTLLDAIQLALYGPRARTSNRGRGAYHDYLRACIHRGSDPGEGAGIRLRWRRWQEGEAHHYELSRQWRVGIKGIEESFEVRKDGLPDDLLTQHWPETIAGYLPERLAHLFFFDGEQIKDLAEGQHAAAIIGSAIDGLLGTDLVERLGNDLRVFERGVRAEQHAREQDNEAAQALRAAEAQLKQLQDQLDAAALEEGAAVNASNQLAAGLQAAKDAFTAAGGDLYQRREALEQRRAELRQRRQATEDALRALIAGPLPLGLVDGLLEELADRAAHETGIRQARLLAEVLDQRDAALLDHLANLADDGAGTLIEHVRSHLAQDRRERAGLAQEPLLLDADDQLAARIGHLRGQVLPEAQSQAGGLRRTLAQVQAELEGVEGELDQVPSAEHIAAAQRALEQAQAAFDAKQHALEQLRRHRADLQRRQGDLETRIERLARATLDDGLSVDHRRRMLRHSAKVRDTLTELRRRVIARHADRIEALILECFQRLLHKPGLAHRLRIDPDSYRITLIGGDGHPLPFDRLSAGERQLLATAMLWGLARASGRPIPTIIDTPLGRLDSSHRRNLVDRYFPAASHQVILLSTDQELVGPYHEQLAPYVARHYLLAHDSRRAVTSITEGYFAEYEAAS